MRFCFLHVKHKKGTEIIPDVGTKNLGGTNYW